MYSDVCQPDDNDPRDEEPKQPQNDFRFSAKPSAANSAASPLSSLHLHRRCPTTPFPRLFPSRSGRLNRNRWRFWESEMLQNEALEEVKLLMMAAVPCRGSWTRFSVSSPRSGDAGLLDRLTCDARSCSMSEEQFYALINLEFVMDLIVLCRCFFNEIVYVFYKKKQINHQSIIYANDI
ncbi:hypothetical protein D8674_016505 [Pyrus ussuriensis x Pyrus communis]|uniref:Uncharacterized protein n=1 Tax=Pyrus ussuriensis x Pyrus communis TaxID=2448454 RepID=A0A5N5HAE1_9ROSA|nr:hypothetical protein D8674_016505 [Pyrus ussuriensis x Pyrus communis]